MSEPANRAVRLANQLRQSIRSGEYATTQALPSERSLCTTTGFSRTTVRRALQILEREGVVERISGSGTFVHASRLTQTAQPTLGLVVPNFANPYYGLMADAIVQQAKTENYQLLVSRSNYDGDTEAHHLFDYAENAAVKGVLVVPSWQEPPLEAYHRLGKKQIPYVFLSRDQTGIDADLVISDRKTGALDVVRHLIGLGHYEIAYIRGIPPEIDLHYAGYAQALREAEIAEDPRRVVSVPAGHEDAGREGVRYLIEANVPFTAIFARNDLTAVGVLQELVRREVAVPTSVSLVGFDNIPIAAHLQPPLTTVNTSVHEMGRLAVSLLLDRIEGRYTGPSRQVLIRTQLLLRNSTAPPP